MFLGKYLLGGAGIALVLALAWGFRVDSLRAGWKAKTEQWEKQAGVVVVALQTASDNPGVDWKSAPNQILALGDDKRQWQMASQRQSEAIRQMADATAAMQARGAELRRIADDARAKRQAALRKLSDIATTPAEKADCAMLLKEANRALDIAYQEGL